MNIFKRFVGVYLDSEGQEPRLYLTDLKEIEINEEKIRQLTEDLKNNPSKSFKILRQQQKTISMITDFFSISATA